MENKELFEFMTKMYSEMTSKFESIEKNMATKEDLKEVKNELTKISTTIENDINPNIKLALDGYHDTNEKLTRLEGKIDNISEKVDTHDMQMEVIKGGKRA